MSELPRNLQITIPQTSLSNSIDYQLVEIRYTHIIYSMVSSYSLLKSFNVTFSVSSLAWFLIVCLDNFVIAAQILLLTHVFVATPGKVQCNRNEFPCVDNLQCIPDFAVCDNITQCRDESDEWSCRKYYRYNSLLICTK